MKTFEIIVDAFFDVREAMHTYVRVEAENEEEAKTKALDEVLNEPDGFIWEHSDFIDSEIDEETITVRQEIEE